MKRLAISLLIVLLGCALSVAPAKAEGWDSLLSGLTGLLESEDDSKSKEIDELFEDLFSGKKLEVTVAGRKLKIHENFKLAMDAYEVFMDEYIDFMSNPDMLEYVDILTKYESFLTAIDEMDEEEMSEQESLYFLDVQMRINEKLMKSID